MKYDKNKSENCFRCKMICKLKEVRLMLPASANTIIGNNYFSYEKTKFKDF